MTALAYVFTFLKNAIYGTTNFFTKGLNSNNIDAIDILALRFLLSFVILWLLKITRLIRIEVGIKDVFKKNRTSSVYKTAIFSGAVLSCY